MIEQLRVRISELEAGVATLKKIRATRRSRRRPTSSSRRRMPSPTAKALAKVKNESPAVKKITSKICENPLVRRKLTRSSNSNSMSVRLAAENAGHSQRLGQPSARAFLERPDDLRTTRPQRHDVPEIVCRIADTWPRSTRAASPITLFSRCFSMFSIQTKPNTRIVRERVQRISLWK